jgi:hypothetical protein
LLCHLVTCAVTLETNIQVRPSATAVLKIDPGGHVGAGKFIVEFKITDPK